MRFSWPKSLPSELLQAQGIIEEFYAGMQQIVQYYAVKGKNRLHSEHSQKKKQSVHESFDFNVAHELPSPPRGSSPRGSSPRGSPKKMSLISLPSNTTALLPPPPAMVTACIRYTEYLQFGDAYGIIAADGMSRISLAKIYVDCVTDGVPSKDGTVTRRLTTHGFCESLVRIALCLYKGENLSVKNKLKALLLTMSRAIKGKNIVHTGSQKHTVVRSDYSLKSTNGSYTNASEVIILYYWST